MVRILCTFDYEIFGNGSGDIKTCLINPTEEILKLLAKFNISATFFVDYGLLFALEEMGEEQRIRNFGYDPLEAIWEQLKEMIKNHDIQLHVHPQMIHAPYIKNRFLVDLSRWRISDLPFENTEDPFVSINGLLKHGKSYLENKLQSVKKDYQCIAFRAGGLCAQPEQELIKGLRANHFLLDFSTSYRYSIDAWPAKVDYSTTITSNNPRKINNNYHENGEEGEIITFPIYGCKYYRWSELFKKLRRRIKKEQKKKWILKRPEGCQGEPQKLLHTVQNKAGKIKSFFMPEIFRFYLEGDAERMIWCFKDAYKRNKSKNIYMVGIGHPKAMGDLSELECFLDFIQVYKESIEFFTASEVANIIQKGAL